MQDKWSANMQTKHKSTDAFWRHASYLTSQFKGLYAGYKYVAESQTHLVVRQQLDL